jgi:hypothetical protein
MLASDGVAPICMLPSKGCRKAGSSTNPEGKTIETVATILAWITGVGAGLCLLSGLILFIFGAVVDGAAATVALTQTVAFGTQGLAAAAFVPSLLSSSESQTMAKVEDADGKDGSQDDGSADPSAGFFELIKRAFGILFYRGSKEYRRGQRMMAAGLVLICLAFAFFIVFVPALIAAMNAGGGSSAPSSSATATATSTA